jgi:hypothetical protein
VVTPNGQNHYLEIFSFHKSIAAYTLIAQWPSNHRQLPTGPDNAVTISELSIAY